MSVVYERAGGDVVLMALDILQAHHPELMFGEGEYPRLCILMASGADPGEPNVKSHGYPRQAVISVIPYKQRVDKRADAEIIIDERVWHDLPEPKQRALLDHEITHLELVMDGDGILKTDDMGRPKLRLRLHDFQLGGFRVIAKRYGEDAPEVVIARDFERRYGSDVLPPVNLFT